MRKVVGLSVCASIALGSTILPQYTFQEYMDFGQNKGRFTPNAKNLYVVKKNGEKEYFDSDVTMPDFVGTGDKSGIVTFMFGSYVFGVQHNLSDSFSYLDGTYITKAKGGEPYENSDLGYARLSKMVTSNERKYDFIEKNTNGEGVGTEKYGPVFRSGAGNMYYKRDSSENHFSGVGIRTGGTLDYDHTVRYNGGDWGKKEGEIRWYFFQNNHRTPLYNHVTMGDSGSATYMWDKESKRWVIGGGVTRCVIGYPGEWYVPHNEILFKEFIAKHTQTPTSNTWGKDILTNKDIFLKSGSTITLTQDINQGDGGIYFKGSNGTTYTVTGANQNSSAVVWKGGGVSIDEGVTVNWQVKGQAGKARPNGGGYTSAPDYLHKIGKGTLKIEVENGGGLNLGEGKVILDVSSKAFQEIILLSGRATLELVNGKGSALDPNHLFFGSRGGTLDVKGNDITFNLIHASDIGTKIINTDSKISTLRIEKKFVDVLDTPIEGSGSFLYHGVIGDKIKIVKDGKDQGTCSFGGTFCESGYGKNILIFDGEILGNSSEIEHLNGTLTLQGHPVIHAYLDPAAHKEAIQKILNVAQDSDIYTSPTRLNQEDWETRRFILKQITLGTTDALTEGKPQTSTFVLGRNAILLTDIIAQNTQAYFGGKKEIYVDRWDGENISPVSSGSQTSHYRFNQKLTGGTSQKDDSFYFEGNLNGSNSSHFFVSNTPTNPLRFGKFQGFDRADLELKTMKEVNYKASFDTTSSLQAKYLELWGAGDRRLS